MLRDGYQRDDWRRLQLNDAVEDALSKILRFGFDIDHVTVKPATADALRGQILAWAKHIACEIPGYSNWQEIYDLTFEALYTPDAVLGSDVGTEAYLVTTIADPDLVGDYALQDKDTEKKNLADHALSLAKARIRLAILDRIPSHHTTAKAMPLALAHLLRKIRYTYKLRECLLRQVGSLELAADMNMNDELEYYVFLIQMKLRCPDRHRAVSDWQTRAVANHRPVYTAGTSGHMISDSRSLLNPQGCANADHPTLECLRLTLLAALIGFNQHHTYDECMAATDGLTQGDTTLNYTDPIGYRDILNSEDPFVREKVGKPLLQAITKIGKQFIANFEEHQAALAPPLPHPGLLVAQWFNDTTGSDWQRLSRSGVASG